MMLRRETAQKLAEDKHGLGVYVGDLNEVWAEANKRAREEGKRQPGQIRLERLDGTYWNDDSDCWSDGWNEIITNGNSAYYYVLMKDYYVKEIIQSSY